MRKEERERERKKKSDDVGDFVRGKGCKDYGNGRGCVVER